MKQILLLLTCIILMGGALNSCISLSTNSSGESKTVSKTESQVKQNSQQSTSTSERTILSVEPVVNKEGKIIGSKVHIDTGRTAMQLFKTEMASLAKAIATAEAKAKARSKMQITYILILLACIAFLVIYVLIKLGVISFKVFKQVNNPLSFFGKSKKGH